MIAAYRDYLLQRDHDPRNSVGVVEINELLHRADHGDDVLFDRMRETANITMNPFNQTERTA